MPLRNLDALKRKLAKIPGAVRSPVKAAIEQNADDLVALQKRLAPKRTGKLAASVHKQSGATDLSAEVTVDAPYARFVEFGTASGTEGDVVTTKDRNTLQGIKPGGRTRKVKRTHPGTPAQPFFYPAYRALKKTMKGRVSRAVTKGIKAAVE